MQSDIINYCKNSETINGILELFKERLLIDLNDTKTKERPNIMKALPYIYRMWYFSSLIDDTSLTPANFINIELNEFIKEDSIIVPLPNPVFNNRVLMDFEFNFIPFSIISHPVLTDLQLFINNCSPDIEVDENGLLIDVERDELIPSLCFKEIFYVTFLTNTAYELKLLRKMPSINTFRAMADLDNVKSFFQLSSEEQLNKIVGATINIASKTLCEIFPVDRKIFSASALLKLFGDANDLNVYLDEIYSKYGLNIDELEVGNINVEDLENIGNLDISEETLSAIVLRMELAFYMDAYLLTPLGYYLQLIRPIYIEHFNFEMYFLQLKEAARANVPIIKLYFFMANGFDITTLGRQLFLKGKKPKHEYQKIIGDFDFKEFYNEIKKFNSIGFDLNDTELGLDLLEKLEEKKNQRNKAYIFKVKHFYNKRSWKTIAIKGIQNLDNLAKAIIDIFELDGDHLYGFFMNNKAYDPNYEICCPLSFNKNDITTNYKICELELMLKQKILFINDFGEDIRFEVEFIDIEPIEKGNSYPHLKTSSKI